jgi:hypothetical protein
VCEILYNSNAEKELDEKEPVKLLKIIFFADFIPVAVYENTDYPVMADTSPGVDATKLSGTVRIAGKLVQNSYTNNRYLCSQIKQFI